MKSLPKRAIDILSVNGLRDELGFARDPFEFKPLFRLTVPPETGPPVTFGGAVAFAGLSKGERARVMTAMSLAELTMEELQAAVEDVEAGREGAP